MMSTVVIHLACGECEADGQWLLTTSSEKKVYVIMLDAETQKAEPNGR